MLHAVREFLVRADSHRNTSDMIRVLDRDTTVSQEPGISWEVHCALRGTAACSHDQFLGDAFI